MTTTPLAKKAGSAPAHPLLTRPAVAKRLPSVGASLGSHLQAAIHCTIAVAYIPLL